MTGFVDERLDSAIEKGAQGGPSFMTTVIQLANGYEQRNQEWVYPRAEWDIAYGIQSAAEFQDVKNLYFACRGRLYGFRFQDWADYKLGDPDNLTTSGAQSVGVGNALNTQFQLYKRYTTSGGTAFFDRPVTRPQLTAPSTMHVYLNNVLKTEGTDYTVGYDTGVITFTSAPGAGIVVTVSCYFDIPVRFDADAFAERVEWTDAVELPSVKVIELKEFNGVV